jgi:hypothetical protein
MNAPFRLDTLADRHDRQLKILRARSQQLAKRVKNSELPFIEAVDACYDAAESAGLLDLPGYVLPGNYLVEAADLVQLVLAEAFADARPT